MSLYPDNLDYFKNKQRRDNIFFGFVVFGLALLLALSLFLSCGCESTTAGKDMQRGRHIRKDSRRVESVTNSTAFVAWLRGIIQEEIKESTWGFLKGHGHEGAGGAVILVLLDRWRRERKKNGRRKTQGPIMEGE